MSDDFVRSMTFAASSQGGPSSCDCDECGAFPLSILAALRNRKRQRLEMGAAPMMTRTQHREFLQRHGNISLYRLTMPSGAAPLVEFGNSHRLIWIQRQPAKGTFRSIGKGIIGSSDEEQSRLTLDDWTEGTVVLVPSNGGKAVGWIFNHNNDNNSHQGDDNSNDKDKQSQQERIVKDSLLEATSTGGPAVMLVAKIPVDRLQQCQEAAANSDTNDINDNDEPDWVKTIVECCRTAVGEWQERESNKSKGSSCGFYKVSQEHANTFKEQFNHT
jgi:hypothetical protein